MKGTGSMPVFFIGDPLSIDLQHGVRHESHRQRARL
jgi:hypothetical protein